MFFVFVFFFFFLMMFKLIDIGANLLDSVYQGEYNGKKQHETDLDSIFQRAKAVGVEKIIVTAGTQQESQDAITFTQAWGKSMPGLYSTVGVHPTRCTELEEGASSIARLIEIGKTPDSKIAAIGEIGLDYERLQFCPQDVQKKWFETMLCDLSDSLQLPLFLHMREAASDFLDIMARNRTHWEQYGGVVHSFTGTPDDVQQILSLGLSIGINGCSLKTKENVEAVKLIPEDKLLLETDAPYCEIRPSHASYAGAAETFKTMAAQWPEVRKDRFKEGCRVKSRNEPCGMLPVLAAVAEIRGVPKDQLAEAVYKNTVSLFKF